MAAFASMLRGINVGRNKRVRMADLKRTYESLGFKNVQTLLQSGNVVFTNPKASSMRLEGNIERALAAELNLDAKVIIRSPDELRRVIAGNPLKLSAGRNASFLHVCFLKMEPAKESVEKMSAAYTGPEEIQVVGRECYIYYPDGAGKSRLDLERWLKVAATARNWNTVNRLAELAASLDA